MKESYLTLIQGAYPQEFCCSAKYYWSQFILTNSELIVLSDSLKVGVMTTGRPHSLFVDLGADFRLLVGDQGVGLDLPFRRGHHAIK